MGRAALYIATIYHPDSASDVIGAAALSTTTSRNQDDDVALLRTAMGMHLHSHHIPPQYMAILDQVVHLPSDVSPTVESQTKEENGRAENSRNHNKNNTGNNKRDLMDGIMAFLHVSQLTSGRDPLIFFIGND